MRRRLICSIAVAGLAYATTAAAIASAQQADDARTADDAAPADSAAVAAEAAANRVLGLWATEPNDDGEYSHVEISRCEDRYCGRVVWLSHPTYEEAGEWGPVGSPKVDWKNDDDELKSRPILGLEIMHSFRYDAEDDDGRGKWKDGRIYDPESGNDYRCEMKIEDGVLKVRGYVRIAFVNVGRTTEWTRVEDG